MLTTPQTVIDRARSLWYVSSNQYTDAIALEDYNIVRQLLSNYIMSAVNEGFFGDTITTTAVVGQNEYTLTDDTSSVKVNKVNEIWIKYNSGDNYIKATKVDEGTQSSLLSTYNGSPVFFIKSDSVFIYPAVEDLNVTAWIRMEVDLTPGDLTIAAADTLFPREHKNVIALWMIPLIYQRRGLINEANNAKAVFESSRSDMVMELTDRVGVPENVTFPSLSYYE